MSGGSCQEEDVARAIAEQCDLRFYDLESIEIPPQVVHLVPGDIARDKHPFVLFGVLKVLWICHFYLSAL